MGVSGGDITEEKEWETQPWADRVTRESVIGWRNPIPPAKFLFLRMLSNNGIKDSMISEAENTINKRNLTSCGHSHEGIGIEMLYML